MFRPGYHRQVDRICFCNTAGVLFDEPELRRSLLALVVGGKGSSASMTPSPRSYNIRSATSGAIRADAWCLPRTEGIPGTAWT
jgi:hypothetical protein